MWNRILVPKFLRFRDIMVRSLGAHGDVAFRAHPPRAGERMLDMGCGFGDSSLQIARAVGPSGWLLGIDCCDAFLDAGRQGAERDGIDNVHCRPIFPAMRSRA